MRYILQIHTGSFDRITTKENVSAALSDLLCRLPAEAVIFGWHKDHMLNKEIVATIKRHQAKAFFWLPVFSENNFPKPFVSCGGSRQNIGHGEESFSFCCVSSPENIETTYQSFHSICQNLDLDGVFLDRIRYPSPANGFSMFKGCFCDRCRALYTEHNIDVSWLARLTPAQAATAFFPSSAPAFRYSSTSPSAQALMTLKREIITKRVTALIDRFHAAGYKVGLDLFDPALADFVGQDVSVLAAKADFSKPMLYRVTNAPAGIPFELQAIRDNLGEPLASAISQINGGDLIDPDTCKRRLRQMCAFGAVYPGIEVNKIEPICRSSPQSVQEGIAIAQQAGCKGVVLSWNMLDAPAEHLQVIEQLNAAFF